MSLLEKGKKAPAFTLLNEKNEKVKLKDLMGRKGLVLYFYPKDNTSGCTKEACAFRDNYSEFKKAGWNVVGVSKDSVKSHQKFIDKQSLNFTLLSDESLKMLEKYGVWQKKKMAGREYMGIVRSTYLITPNGKIAGVYPKVKPAEHAKQILEDIKVPEI